MQRSYGASWELANLPDPPFDLRATDDSGQQVVARWVGGAALFTVLRPGLYAQGSGPSTLGL